MIGERKVITLSNGGKYLIIHEIGKLDENEKERYFFAMGVTPEYDLDTEDALFLSVCSENGEEIVTKVDEDTELYKSLSVLEVVSSLMDNVSGYKEQLQKEIEKMEQEGSN